MSSAAFQDAASATSDASGIYAVVFQSVRLGYIWTGSVQIPSAVPASVLPVKFTAFDSGIPIGSWYNDQSSPNIQVQQQLSITASGLVASTKFQAFFKGMITPAAETPPFWPGPTPAPPVSGPFQLINTQTSVNATTLISGGQVQVLAPTAVVVGTSLEIRYFTLGGGMNGQIQILWAASATASASSSFTFDVNGAGTPAVLSGLVLPNLDAFVSIIVASAVAASPVCRLSVLTGLPPIVRPPLISGGDLTRFNTSIADGGDSGEITLPPYVGDAQLFLTAEVAGASPAAGAIFARLTSQDYLGVSSELARVGAATQLLAAAGTTSLQPGYIWKMSPRINSIRVFNRIGGGTAVTVSMAISVSGP